MTEHNHFKILCALAVSGQLGEAELQEVNEHLEQCSDCRMLAAEFEQISIQIFASQGPGLRSCSVPKGMTARFVARAFSEGIPIQSSGKSPATSNSLRILNCAGALIAGILAVSMSLSGNIRPLHSSDTAEISSSVSSSSVFQTGRVETQMAEGKKMPQRSVHRTDLSRRNASRYSAAAGATPERESLQLLIKIYPSDRVPPVFPLRNVSFLDFSDRASMEGPVSEKDTASAKLASMHWEFPLNVGGASSNTADPLLLSQMQQRGTFGADSFPKFHFRVLESISSR